ncbi:C40 family peptidase [Gloeothece verrucosa]|uniref:NLP/P60 protein n=1 Tax=Gloeothece verrucosa (strain PCC 7822) TaxID=497965 RepID=E0U765_GLOV7|nr:C40 family peptidase [Gloeothece verrucosa]ADN17221.1 NLP/P60 protein [Gloeothece verrucosa PCC 7822]
MTFLNDLPPSPNGQYCTQNNLDLYNSPNCQELATQAAKGRYLRLLWQPTTENVIQVQLCEDDYLAWLPLHQLSALLPAKVPYQALALSRHEIEKRLPDVMAFTQAAYQTPNYYLWGGTVAPNYDCSGLIQAAFAASNIWLPRDSYQQEAFTARISQEELILGDLIFFGDQRVNHVALYLGEGYYIHSSGKEKGRNGIGIDQLRGDGDEVSRAYYQKLWSFGRVMSNYCPN